MVHPPHTLHTCMMVHATPDPYTPTPLSPPTYPAARPNLPHFEPDLVVARASGPVSHCVRAHLYGDLNLALGDKRAGDGGTQEVHTLVQGVGPAGWACMRGRACVSWRYMPSYSASLCDGCTHVGPAGRC